MPHRNVTIAYERIAELEAETARLREDLSECIKEGQEKLDLCANEIRCLKSRIEGRDEDLKSIYAEKERLKALIASGILLKQHSADERPEGYRGIGPRFLCLIPKVYPETKDRFEVLFWLGDPANRWFGNKNPIAYYGPIELTEDA